jgi:FMN phosphatase YigB (HAD superfamily)
MIKQVTIFDLDGTVIDSSHRQLYNANGKLNLNKWLENNTPEKIFKDKILPLAQEMRRRHKKGDYIIINTARCLSYADYEFMMENGIFADKIIDRPNGNMENDAKLKRKQLNSFLSLKQFKQAHKIMFDDNNEVRSLLRQIGISVIHPNKYNKVA